MKLTLCVPLIWMLFSSAEALECVQEYHRSDAMSRKGPEPCNPPGDDCATVSNPDLTNSGSELYSVRRTCLPSYLCNKGDQSFALRYGDVRLAASLQCCPTDGCNDKPIPISDLHKQIPNGLECFSCPPSDSYCDQKHQCVGIQDRCIILDATDRGRTNRLRGCASANLCEGHTDQKVKLMLTQSIYVDDLEFTSPKCCDTNLCNSAPADKLSVIPLLLALVVFSVS
ncbi:phospholipase A2 inhibitor gamma subunit B-like [Halichoeres trimaculatus]|uniref:phospholipase A2 inhibitor gamma subunit B-like n=1 Tax=Halichoeres trimaculatus TaxID=147232 RepID=UPI003D9F97ED